MNTQLCRLLLCLLLLTTQQAWAWSSQASVSGDLQVSSSADKCPHHDGMIMAAEQSAAHGMTMDQQGCSHDGHCQCAHASTSTPVPPARSNPAVVPTTTLAIADIPSATLDVAITPPLRPPARF